VEDIITVQLDESVNVDLMLILLSPITLPISLKTNKPSFIRLSPRNGYKQKQNFSDSIYSIKIKHNRIILVPTRRVKRKP
jgi:hypothetical protein